MAEPHLSIVIPAYNEVLRIGNTLREIRRYLESRNYSCELIVVDDGSRDGTARVVEEFARKNAWVRLARNSTNRGKGYAVRQGMLEAKGFPAFRPPHSPRCAGEFGET